MKNNILIISLLTITLSFFSCAPKVQKKVLMSSDWTLIKIKDKSLQETDYGLRFNKDELMGLTNCNYISTEYNLTKSHIKIKSLSITEMACEGNNFEFEDFYFLTLSGKFEYALNGNQLIMKNDETVLEFKKSN